MRVLDCTMLSRMKIFVKILQMVLLLLLTDCSTKRDGSPQAFFQHPSDQKLKQKTALLQKKIKKAEQVLSDDQQSVEKLRLLLCEAELNLIESKIDNLEKRFRIDPQRALQALPPNVSNLFIDERETLIRVIQHGPEKMRAQILLDRVLQLITQMSDSR